jgi:hypothetical protein
MRSRQVLALGQKGANNFLGHYPVRRLQDGLRVRFDEWALDPGDGIPAKIVEELERLRVLALCMSANAFGDA